jgi:prepilin-type N-terminal cleavage/methylation domain-containing protein
MILNKFIKRKFFKGFTLIELLIVIDVIAIIAAVAFVALNPLKRFADSRNSRRQMEIKSIADAISLYTLDHKRSPDGIDDSLKMLGTSGSGCEAVCGQEVIAYNYHYGSLGYYLTKAKDYLQNEFAARAAQEIQGNNESNRSHPEIISAQVIPKKVFPGDKMLIMAEVRDDSGIS